MFIKLHTNGWKHMSGIFKEVEKVDNEISLLSYGHFTSMWDLPTWKKMKGSLSLITWGTIKGRACVRTGEESGR